MDEDRRLPDVEHVGEVRAYRFDRGRTRSLFVLGIVLGMSPFVVAAALAVVLARDPRFRLVGVVAGFVVAALIFWSLLALVVVAVRRIAIITSPAGITYRQLGFRVSARWDDVLRVGPVPAGVTYGEGLVLRGSGLQAPRWLAWSLRANRADCAIPLTTIQWWWRDGPLGDDLRRYAPWLFDPTGIPVSHGMADRPADGP